MAELDTAKVLEKQQFKKNLLLRRIRRRGQAGRLELARTFRMSNSRVCDLIQEMLDDHLLVEDHKGTERRGRRPVPVMVNPGYGHLIGFDMEARALRLIAADFSGKIVWQREKRLTSPKSRRTLVNRLLEFIGTGLKEVKRRHKNVLGIGLAAPGLIDLKKGVIIHYDLVEGARDIPLRDLVADRTGLPCLVEQNIRALTLAEWMSGAARDLQTFICLAVRSGIGVGIVIDGRLYTGSHGFAGEAGFMPLPLGTAVGRWKYLNQVASEQTIRPPGRAGARDLPKGRAARAGEILGSQLTSLAAVLDPQAVVLAGGLIQPDGPLYEAMVRTFRRFALPETADRIGLLPAALGPFAAARGATHRVFQMLYPTEPPNL